MEHCDLLRSQLASGIADEVQKALAAIQGHVWQLSQHATGRVFGWNQSKQKGTPATIFSGRFGRRELFAVSFAVSFQGQAGLFGVEKRERRLRSQLRRRLSTCTARVGDRMSRGGALDARATRARAGGGRLATRQLCDPEGVQKE